MLKKNKSSVKKAFLTSFICSLAIFSTVVALNMKSFIASFGKNPCAPFSDTVSRPAVQNQAVSSVQSFNDYISETIFVGDSRTNGFLRYKYIPEQNILAKNGENHQAARTERLVTLESGKSVTIAQAVGIKKPKRMIVSFGINGVAFMGKDNFMKEYSALADELHTQSPNSILVIQSILPVSKEFENSDSRYSNSIIDQYNKLLKAMADEKGFRFLDSSSVLKDKNNCLASKYDSGDGLHFGKEAYDALMRFYDEHRID